MAHFCRSLALPLPILAALALPAVAKPPFGDKAAAHHLAEVVKLDPTIRLDVRYATTNNFMKRVLYPEARVFLVKPAAQALVRVQKKLAAKHLGLVVFDGYRPWNITKAMWDQTPENQRQYVANPAKGSRHNRGCAVDLSLVDLQTGQTCPMPSQYDDFSSKAHANYPTSDATARYNRALLRETMQSEGFQVYPFEWWHFDFRGWEQFPVLNESFAALDKLR